VSKLAALSAAYSTEGHDVESLVSEMLSIMKHRGRRVTHTHLLPGLGLGYASNNPNNGFLESEIATLALNGTFFKTSTRAQARMALSQSLENFTSIARLPGAFAVLSTKPAILSAVRDPLGLKPLYYSQKSDVTAIASERKALWQIGHTVAERILPGYLYTVKSQRLTKKRLFRFFRPHTQSMTIDYAASRLKQLLQHSIRLITSDVSRVAVAFSGGLDSAITALLAKQANLQVELISTGLRGSSELEAVEKYAKELDLPIKVERYDTDSLHHYIKRLIWLIEEPNLMKVSIAIPLHWAAMLAARQGHSVMLCGQGSDELYGGYYKYARILDNEGKRALMSALYRSIIEAPQINYERDEQATCPSGVDLRTPFANLDVIDFSLKIPLEFKVKPGNDLVRKWVLRVAARMAELPENMVLKRKKAIQHGTGVEKAIRKLAKTEKLTVEGYLSKVKSEISNLKRMP
jgi:asparagine synthase (glutamine-hydrolysing)